MCGVGYLGWRWYRATRRRALPAPASPELTEIRELERKVLDLVEQFEGLVDIPDRVAEIRATLTSQLELRDRIAKVLAGRSAQMIAEEIEAGEQRVAEARNEDAAAAAEHTLERLQVHREQHAQLSNRHTILAAACQAAIVDLRNLQLALLTALSSGETADASRLDDARRALAQASDRLRTEAAATSEIDAMLR